MTLTRCRRIFKGDGLYIPSQVRLKDKPSVIVGWVPTKGFCADLGEGELVLANNPLDAPRIATILSSMSDLYDEASRLRDEYADLLDEGSQLAETFLQQITADRTPEEEPPDWSP